MKRIFALLLLVSCATPYQPRAWSGGYTDQRLAPDVFQVDFAANGFSDEATTRSYLLYRCAEVTQQNGYDHFVLLSDEDQTALTLAPNLNVYTKPAYSAKIKLGKGPKPAGANAYAAADVLKELAPKIKR